MCIIIPYWTPLKSLQRVSSWNPQDLRSFRERYCPWKVLSFFFFPFFFSGLSKNNKLVGRLQGHQRPSQMIHCLVEASVLFVPSPTYHRLLITALEAPSEYSFGLLPSLERDSMAPATSSYPEEYLTWNIAPLAQLLNGSPLPFDFKLSLKHLRSSWHCPWSLMFLPIQQIVKKVRMGNKKGLVSLAAGTVYHLIEAFNSDKNQIGCFSKWGCQNTFLCKVQRQK